jgi:alpha-1,3-glucosyltransferase
MGLYYAPAIGCYLLGKCVWLGGLKGYVFHLLLSLYMVKRRFESFSYGHLLIECRVTHLVKLGLTTIMTFFVLYYPWLRPFPSAIQQVVHRMFPFARGIFEDKVANFWCASNVVVKWRRWFDVGGMARVSQGF